MKIGIEVQRIFRRKKHGMEVVALELIHQLQKIDGKNSFVLFAKNDTDSECISETNKFKVHKTKPVAFPIWEQLYFQSLLKKIILHSCIARQYCTSVLCHSDNHYTFTILYFLKSWNFQARLTRCSAIYTEGLLCQKSLRKAKIHHCNIQLYKTNYLSKTENQ
jgi:hypothetical protein